MLDGQIVFTNDSPLTISTYEDSTDTRVVSLKKEALQLAIGNHADPTSCVYYKPTNVSYVLQCICVNKVNFDFYVKRYSDTPNFKGFDYSENISEKEAEFFCMGNGDSW